jgi:hypothetical protein
MPSGFKLQAASCKQSSRTVIGDANSDLSIKYKSKPPSTQSLRGEHRERANKKARLIAGLYSYFFGIISVLFGCGSCICCM